MFSGKPAGDKLIYHTGREFEWIKITSTDFIKNTVAPQENMGKKVHYFLIWASGTRVGTGAQEVVTCSMSTIEKLKLKLWDMFKVNNKDGRVVPMM